MYPQFEPPRSPLHQQIQEFPLLRADLVGVTRLAREDVRGVLVEVATVVIHPSELCGIVFTAGRGGKMDDPEFQSHSEIPGVR